MNEFLERIAREACESLMQQNHGREMLAAEPWEGLHDLQKAAWGVVVQSVMKSMREPLDWAEKMADREAVRILKNSEENLSPYFTWKIMIDATIKETD